METFNLHKIFIHKIYTYININKYSCNYNTHINFSFGSVSLECLILLTQPHREVD